MVAMEIDSREGAVYFFFDSLEKYPYQMRKQIQKKEKRTLEEEDWHEEDEESSRKKKKMQKENHPMEEEKLKKLADVKYHVIPK